MKPRIKLKIQNLEDRERMVLALANSGYSVAIESYTTPTTINIEYFVVFEKYEPISNSVSDTEESTSKPLASDKLYLALKDIKTELLKRKEYNNANKIWDILKSIFEESEDKKEVVGKLDWTYIESPVAPAFVPATFVPAKTKSNKKAK